MAEPARRRATYQDVLDAPENLVAEVIDGELVLSARPAASHASVSSTLGAELGPPFGRGRGGPGGWIILDEPELHLGVAPQIMVPDLAGWRRERLPSIGPEMAFFTLAPDWVCEVVSPSTGKLDRARKLPLYAAFGVRHAWIVEPLLRTLEVRRLEGGRWVELGTFADDAKLRAEPFDAIELELGALWADLTAPKP